ncbi:putative phosphodiesterase [Paenibacillus phyllosphaerae]|uniref:Putative phosphodiesterase n=1 Tax=Paenibacillus phyllosphaerae TaxID=274593 RepID=A0A7W5AXX7_9BACL|nr:metallophosphoesterase family protein [Paenibacillus phyllosphaerae]MBB3110808.1 putative phosphodiesterase [Paenibacillus phyllosphaerae]
MRGQNIALIAVVIALIIVAVVFMLWKKEGSSPMPESLVTTFHDDPRVSRAFTWYTDTTKSASVVQLVPAVGKVNFGGPNVITITGASSVIDEGKGVKRGVHKVNVTGLTPGTAYTYRVGSGEPEEWSEPAQFTTEGEEEAAFSFINVTDSQGTTEADFKLWGATLARAFALFPQAQFIVHNGDFTEEPTDETAWEQLFTQSRSWVTSIPLMPVTGNHDEVDGNAERFVSHFHVPNNGAGGSIPGTSYSFNYGSAHIVVLNTESNLKGQIEWLRNDLALTDKPWKIVAMHRGAYGGSMYKKLDKWVEIFDEQEVDLVLQGHNHEYSRSYPLRDGRITGDGNSPVRNHAGTMYVVTNTAGTKFNEKKEDLFYHKVHLQNEKQMFAGITIDGDTLTYEAYDVDGQKVDAFVIEH